MKRTAPSSVIVVAGITAALYIGKLPPALPVLRESLQISLVQAGLLVLCAAGTLGGFATDIASLLALRALEGVGLLMACMPGPGLIRQVVAPGERAVSTTVGWMQQWSAFGQRLAAGFDRKGWRKATRPAGHITGGIAK